MDKLIEIIEEIKNTFNFEVETTITNQHGEILIGDEGESEYFIRMDFEDCAEIKKVKCKKYEVETCIRSEMNKSILEEVLYKFKDIGFIEVNIYENGTSLSFVYREEGFDEETLLEVSTPGIHTEELILGEEYYVAFTKYNIDKNDLKKHKLVKIDRIFGNGFYLYFEGLDKIYVNTRGHIKERRPVINRIDHEVIVRNKETFKKRLIQQIGEEYGVLLSKEDNEKLNQLLRNLTYI